MNRRRTFFTLWVIFAVGLFVVVNWRIIQAGRLTEQYSMLWSGDPGLMVGGVAGLVVADLLPAALLAWLASLAVRRIDPRKP